MVSEADDEASAAVKTERGILVYVEGPLVVIAGVFFHSKDSALIEHQSVT